MVKVGSIKHFISSRRGQIVFNYLYSWGAAVVIIGAMFKIIHLPFADYVLMAGMITEACVFLFSAFDHVSANSESGPGVVAGVFQGTDVSTSGTTNIGVNLDAITSRGGSDNSKAGNNPGSVVVIAGGGNGNAGGSSISGAGRTSTGNTSSYQGSTPIPGGSQDNSVPPGYAHSMSATAQNLEEFSGTIQSLNEASHKLLSAYQNITENQGFVENLTTLNQNVSGLNEVFNSQLQTITEQMSAIRYINDSLMRMKNLYDGAIGDSYMFREESAKMTKHIEALNNVYTRLLQAMTTNNNNTNPTNF
ncbi:gliding motility protein GldL [Dysgonomonas sp. Marseille-P4677]|uniref:type IX secretion system motor protein PorL/GldL n=1 Tax=Dysgonomonas sp. Marseille-P4677 TaxID=2364790 RepID=UPI0019138002|nr:gliding motility protein GldL [Dysgonomonas sp. Marseille-P4677]MBK5719735.1 gliding motility protein GldL [Dysgonomonas sp. Marseille-P4677]